MVASAAEEDIMDLSGEVAAGCMCFRGFGWGSSYSYQLLWEEGSRDGWFLTKAKELKAMSELLAGPKWKNFIRKFSVQMQGRRIKREQFGYDAESYALNFDDGDADETRHGMTSFACRM